MNKGLSYLIKVPGIKTSTYIFHLKSVKRIFWMFVAFCYNPDTMYQNSFSSVSFCFHKPGCLFVSQDLATLPAMAKGKFTAPKAPLQPWPTLYRQGSNVSLQLLSDRRRPTGLGWPPATGHSWGHNTSRKTGEEAASWAPLGPGRAVPERGALLGHLGVPSGVGSNKHTWADTWRWDGLVVRGGKFPPVASDPQLAAGNSRAAPRGSTLHLPAVYTAATGSADMEATCSFYPPRLVRLSDPCEPRRVKPEQRARAHKKTARKSSRETF